MSVMCDKFTDKPAVAKFRWAWGEEGNCSLEYQALLNQTARNLKRQIFFAPLALGEPMLQRSERQALIAAKLAAESEASEVAERSAKLYVVNTELRQELERRMTERRELEAQLRDMSLKLDDITQARDRYARESGVLAEELSKAELLLQSAPATHLEEQWAETMRELDKARARIAELEGIVTD